MQKIFTLGTSLAFLMLLGVGCSTPPNNTIPDGQTMPLAVVPPDDDEPAPPVFVEAEAAPAPAKLVTTSTKTVKIIVPPPAGKVAPRAYTDDLKIYRSKGGYMLLLACHGQPGVISIKRGVKFMIDNQDTKPHTVAIGKIFTYRLGARGYTIATAPNAPGQYYLTCDGGGAALVNVEG